MRFHQKVFFFFPCRLLTNEFQIILINYLPQRENTLLCYLKKNKLKEKEVENRPLFIKHTYIHTQNTISLEFQIFPVNNN